MESSPQTIRGCTDIFDSVCHNGRQMLPGGKTEYMQDQNEMDRQTWE